MIMVYVFETWKRLSSSYWYETQDQTARPHPVTPLIHQEEWCGCIFELGLPVVVMVFYGPTKCVIYTKGYIYHTACLHSQLYPYSPLLAFTNAFLAVTSWVYVWSGIRRHTSHCDVCVTTFWLEKSWLYRIQTLWCDLHSNIPLFSVFEQGPCHIESSGM